MNVSWDAMVSSPDMTKYEEHEANTSLNPRFVENSHDPWNSLSHTLISLSLPQQELDDTDRFWGDPVVAQQDIEMALAQGGNYTTWMEQDASSTTGEEFMLGDPANFQNLDHWLTCSNGI
ncbi:hypothetical protein NW762_000118 [Fusarium torreyae]|uniref:Uncharacterized protein n=1 Tax=Fusarium torreyae TaxID=1237075 RepID=A0A9W8VMR8_9HYPO|nr:hypothetical protein NW762_000118 [Fusarium torreyae]